MPVLLERTGPDGVGGAGTAALFLGAVSGELGSLWLMSWQSSKRLVAAGLLVSAVMSLVLIIPQAPAWLMLASSAFRGAGTGVGVVVCSVLVADLASPERRGRSVGLFGLALSVPSIALPSIGVALVGAGRTDVAALIGFAGGLVGTWMALRLPDHKPPSAKILAHLDTAFHEPGLMAVLGSFVLVSLSFGGVLTFAPIVLTSNGPASAAVFLLLVGMLRAASRWFAGLLSDIGRPATVLSAGILLTCLGLVALALRTSPAVTLIAAVAYGAGFGAVQTSGYLAMIERGGATPRTTIGALWSSGIDLGSSIGGALLGASASQLGYANAFWLVPAAVALALPLALLAGRMSISDGAAAGAAPSVNRNSKG